MEIFIVTWDNDDEESRAYKILGTFSSMAKAKEACQGRLPAGTDWVWRGADDYSWAYFPRNGEFEVTRTTLDEAMNPF